MNRCRAGAAARKHRVRVRWKGELKGAEVAADAVGTCLSGLAFHTNGANLNREQIWLPTSFACWQSCLPYGQQNRVFGGFSCKCCHTVAHTPGTKRIRPYLYYLTSISVLVQGSPWKISAEHRAGSWPGLPVRGGSEARLTNALARSYCSSGSDRSQRTSLRLRWMLSD